MLKDLNFKKNFELGVRVKWIFILLAGVLLVSGCIQQEDTQNIIGKCTDLCQEKFNRQVDISDGPCLSDNPNWTIDDWVCDVAHSPRTAEDNLPENQCKEFREEKASHFVEVDPNCEFIRAV